MRLRCRRCRGEQGGLDGAAPVIGTPVSAGRALTRRLSEYAPPSLTPRTFVIWRERGPQRTGEIWPGMADLRQEKDAHPSNVSRVQTVRQAASRYANHKP